MDARIPADLHGDLDISMLLLRYAGMADLCTGAVQRRVTAIPGSAAGHPASRPAAAPGTALSWTCRHRACPRSSSARTPPTLTRARTQRGGPPRETEETEHLPRPGAAGDAALACRQQAASASWQRDMAGNKFVQPGRSQEPHRPFDVASHDGDHAVDACSAAGHEAVEVGAADHGEPGAECDRCDDIGACATWTDWQCGVRSSSGPAQTAQFRGAPSARGVEVDVGGAWGSSRTSSGIGIAMPSAPSWAGCG